LRFNRAAKVFFWMGLLPNQGRPGSVALRFAMTDEPVFSVT
jgi:hypothetical protein